MPNQHLTSAAGRTASYTSACEPAFGKQMCVDVALCI